jgi:hypothetical protein
MNLRAKTEEANEEPGAETEDRDEETSKSAMRDEENAVEGSWNERTTG